MPYNPRKPYDPRRDYDKPDAFGSSWSKAYTERRWYSVKMFIRDRCKELNLPVPNMIPLHRPVDMSRRLPPKRLCFWLRNALYLQRQSFIFILRGMGYRQVTRQEFYDLYKRVYWPLDTAKQLKYITTGRYGKQTLTTKGNLRSRKTLWGAPYKAAERFKKKVTWI